MTILTHYGVPGMRWGVRKNRSSGISKMSDGELKSAISRMNLEREYKKALKPKPSALASGGKFVGGIVSRGTTVVGAKVVATALTGAIRYAVQ